MSEHVPLDSPFVAADAPGASALAFHRTLEVVKRYVLAWDSFHGVPLRCVIPDQPEGDLGGLLGVVLAFHGAIECQARGGLHVHIVVWCASTVNLLSRLAWVGDLIRLKLHPCAQAAAAAAAEPVPAAAPPAAVPPAAPRPTPLEEFEQLVLVTPDEARSIPRQPLVLHMYRHRR